MAHIPIVFSAGDGTFWASLHSVWCATSLRRGIIHNAQQCHKQSMFTAGVHSRTVSDRVIRTVGTLSGPNICRFPQVLRCFQALGQSRAAESSQLVATALVSLQM